MENRDTVTEDTDGGQQSWNVCDVVRCVHDLRNFVKNGAVLQTWKTILANLDGIWKIRKSSSV